MNYLGIDTTTFQLVVCAKIDGELRTAEVSDPQHSQTLMRAIDTVLRGQTDKIDAVGVCVGPGSFTGIRIGVTTAKMLAYLKNIPVVSFTRHELIGYGQADALAVVDGGNHIFYVQPIKDGEGVGEITTVKADAIADVIAGVHAVGDVEGAVHAATDGEAVARVIELKLLQNKTTDCYSAEPLYVQLPQAQREQE